MLGEQTLSFEVSAEPRHQPRFLRSHFGKKATLTTGANTSISTVAALYQPSGSELTVDLYHNPHARVPIPHKLAAPLVRKQYADGIEDPDRNEPTVLDLMQSSDWQERLDDTCRQEIERSLGRKVHIPPSVQYSDRQHIVYWIDKGTGKTKRFPSDGTGQSINEWHAMIFACAVVKSDAVIDVWVADENDERVADREKIVAFANAHGYL